MRIYNGNIMYIALFEGKSINPEGVQHFGQVLNILKYLDRQDLDLNLILPDWNSRQIFSIMRMPLLSISMLKIYLESAMMSNKVESL